MTDTSEFRSGYPWPVLGLVWTWVLPSTALGLTAGLIGLCTGGRCRQVGHTLEFHGGFVTWLLERTPISAAGMTLGHVILGLSPTVLDIVRPHEWVHVRQYERWGPLFLPAYLGCWLVLKLHGRDGYRQNPFEIEAYEADRRRRLDALNPSGEE